MKKELKELFRDPKNIMMIILTISLVIPLVNMGAQLASLLKVYDQMLEHKNNRGSDENIIEMMNEIDSLYDKYYIGEDATSEDIEDGVMRGFASAFDDPYGFYMSPDETEEFLETQDERLMGGIGIQTRYENNMEVFGKYKYSYYITHVYNDSPAEKAGLKVGDRVVQVEDVVLSYVNADDFLEAVRGEAGTEVNITIIRDNELLDIKLIRDDVKSNSVITQAIRNKKGTDEVEAIGLEQAISSDIGYIKINSFSNETDEEYSEAIKDLSKCGISKYILDVRDNSGGVVDTVVKMLDSMLPKGVITEIRYKDASQNVVYESDEKETAGEFIVLVNERSASASELFSKTLQEYGKATIIGELTYGKGTVIQTIGLSNGGSITISTGEYFTSKGENLEGVGVIPDITVGIPDDVENYLYKLPLKEDLQLIRALNELG